MADSTRTFSPAFAILSLLGIVLLLAIGIYCARSHVRAAKSIKVGASPAVVHELLGEATASIKSLAELNELFPPTTSFRFRTLEGDSIAKETIQFQSADWFALGSAGYLVIYEGDAVARTIWGET